MNASKFYARLLHCRVIVSLCAAFLFSGTQVANAEPLTSVRYSLDAGGTWADMPAIGAVGGFTWSGLGVEAFDGAQLLSTNLSLRWTSKTTSGNILIVVGASGYTNPVAPPSIDLVSSIGGNSNKKSDASITFQSYINSANDNTETGLGGFSLGLQTPSLAAGAYSNAVSGSIASLTQPYAVLQSYDITLPKWASGTTISSQPNISFNGETTLTGTPEPTSMALLAIGALGMAGYGWRRRRQSVETKQEEPAPAV